MDLLLRPIVTEKVTSQTEKFNRYAFVVSKDANKIEIKKSVETIYNVSVKSVRTMNYYGKTKNRFTKISPSYPSSTTQAPVINCFLLAMPDLFMTCNIWLTGTWIFNPVPSSTL